MDAAKEAAQADVRIVSIGFGSEEGSKITIVDPETGARTQLTDREGNVVVSRVDGKLLRDIALETDGAYVPAGVSALDLESIVREHIQPIARMSAETRERITPNEQYPWCVLASLIFMFAAIWIGSHTGRRVAG
jgi:Ca-activated chloride channel family protein